MKSLIEYAKTLIAKRRNASDCLKKLREEVADAQGKMSDAKLTIKEVIAKHKKVVDRRLDLLGQAVEDQAAAKRELPKAKRRLAQVQKAHEADESDYHKRHKFYEVRSKVFNFETQMTKEGAISKVETRWKGVDEHHKANLAWKKEGLKTRKEYVASAKSALKKAERVFDMLDADLLSEPKTMQELMAMFAAQEEYIDQVDLD